MEMHEIRYFLAVADTLNFTRAAERCNVSQPALTRAVQRLEERLGGDLVHRERRNTHLTELGRIMQPYLGRVLAQMETARSKAKGYVAFADTRLRLGLMCTIGPGRFVDLLGGFRRRFEGVQVELCDAPVPDLERALLKGDLDIAVYCRPEPMESEHLHVLRLFSERFVVLLPPGHRLAGRNAIGMRDLNSESYLGRRACEFYEHLRRIRLELGGIEFQRPYVSDRDDWVQSMVLAGFGFTYCPEYAVTLPGLVVRPLVEPEVVRHISLVTVRGRPHSPAVGAFVDAARRHHWAETLAGPLHTALGRPAS